MMKFFTPKVIGVLVAVLVIAILVNQWDKIKAKLPAKLGGTPGSTDPITNVPTGNSGTSSGGTKAPVATTNTSGPLNPNILLKKGSRGAEVKALQTWLNNKFGARLVTDGIFGVKTEAALYAAYKEYSTTLYAMYQKGLPVTGNIQNADLSQFNPLAWLFN